MPPQSAQLPFACSSRQYATSCLFILQPARRDFTDESKLSSQQNEMKSFGEKLIKVANVSYLSYCKLNFVGPDVKKGVVHVGWSMDPVQVVVHGLGVSVMYIPRLTGIKNI